MVRRPKSLSWSFHTQNKSNTETSTSMTSDVDSPKSLASSMSTTSGLPKETAKSHAKTSSQALTTATRTALAIETRAQVREQVRTDWAWPSPPTSARVEENTVYVERDLNSSNPPSALPSPKMASKTLKDPYRYLNPDALGQAIADRKRKRDKLIEEELEYNEGLRTYMARRNAWTGSVEHKPSHVKAHDSEESDSDESSEEPKQQMDIDGILTSTFTPQQPAEEQSPSNQTLLASLIPLPLPLIPREHPIRSSISSATYSAIYSKIVLQGQSPSIPINLSDVVKAMVQGWKKEGEWPPKPTQLEPLAGRRKKAVSNSKGSTTEKESLLEKSVGKVRKAFGLLSPTGEEATGIEKVEDPVEALGLVEGDLR